MKNVKCHSYLAVCVVHFIEWWVLIWKRYVAMFGEKGLLQI